LNASVVSAQNLGLTFHTSDGDVVALSDVNLDIGKGEFVSFIGPSGCGKTTFLRVIADLEQPTSGSISVNGMTPAEARTSRAYGYVFQAPALFPWRTIEQNVALPLEIMGYSRAASSRRASSARWSSSTSRASRRSIPGSSRAACSSAPPSPARSPSTPTCCSWTSPSARSTRSCATI
jgi:ABC-type Fe3+/spermidine/putrescine transport system ATPase subunit